METKIDETLSDGVGAVVSDAVVSDGKPLLLFFRWKVF